MPPQTLADVKKKKPPVRKGDYLSEPIQKLAYKLGLTDNPSAKAVREEAYSGTRSVTKKMEPKAAAKVSRDPRDVAPKPAAGNVRDRAAMDAMAGRAKKPEAAAPKKEEAKPNLIRPKGNVPNGIVTGSKKEEPKVEKVDRGRDVAPRPAAGNVYDRAAMDTMARREKEKRGPTPLKIIEKRADPKPKDPNEGLVARAKAPAKKSPTPANPNRGLGEKKGGKPIPSDEFGNNAITISVLGTPNAGRKTKFIGNSENLGSRVLSAYGQLDNPKADTPQKMQPASTRAKKLAEVKAERKAAPAPKPKAKPKVTVKKSVTGNGMVRKAPTGNWVSSGATSMQARAAAPQKRKETAFQRSERMKREGVNRR